VAWSTFARMSHSRGSARGCTGPPKERLKAGGIPSPWSHPKREPRQGRDAGAQEQGDSAARISPIGVGVFEPRATPVVVNMSIRNAVPTPMAQWLRQWTLVLAPSSGVNQFDRRRRKLDLYRLWCERRCLCLCRPTLGSRQTGEIDARIAVSNKRIRAALLINRG